MEFWEEEHSGQALDKTLRRFPVVKYTGIVPLVFSRLKKHVKLGLPSARNR